MKKKDDDKGKGGGGNDGRWRCPVCKVEADIEGRKVHVYVTGHSWPLHWDCEFAKDLDHIDFSKLERVS